MRVSYRLCIFSWPTVQSFYSCTCRPDVCQCLAVQTAMDNMSKICKAHHWPMLLANHRYVQLFKHPFQGNYVAIRWVVVFNSFCARSICRHCTSTGELGYDGPLYAGFLHMMDDMLGPSPLHIKYSSYVYDGFCIWRTNFPGPIESVISKFTCTTEEMQEVEVGD